MAIDSTQHQWTFFRAGKCDQVRLRSADDLLNLERLDQKLWGALGCPVSGLNLDPKMLAWIDSDGDGRIRVPEVLSAVRWFRSLLKDPAELFQGRDVLRLSSIDESAPEGREVIASARRVLASLKKPDAAEISLADLVASEEALIKARFNGDGIVPAQAADDEETRAVIQEAISAVGWEKDRSGEPGLSQPLTDQFFQALVQFEAWWAESEREPAILPLGEATRGAFVVFEAVRAKVDDYFVRCGLAAFDPRAAGALNRDEQAYLEIASRELSSTCPEVASFPLAQIEPRRPLPLEKELNPAWLERVNRLCAEVIGPLLGKKSSLAEAEWVNLKTRLAPYAEWASRQAGAEVAGLSIARVRAILKGGAREKVSALIAEDQKLEPEFAALSKLDKLVRLHKDLIVLLNNFISFWDFYSGEHLAVFQVGRLYLDQRCLELCVAVQDIARHAALAGSSRTYLVYCDLTRKASGETRSIVAALTSGDADYLFVGRHGLFYDHQGQDWDATVTKLVENPVSLPQAVWDPYKKLARFIGSQIEKLASAKEGLVQQKATTSITATSQEIADGKAAAKKEAFDIAKFAGIFAAIGLAIGAIGGAIGALIASFAKLAWWQIPLALLGIFVAISGPSVLLAYLKLRQRTLGPILDGCGWAINTRLRISIPFGAKLTQVAAVPLLAKRELLLESNAKPKGSKIWIWLLLLILLAGIAFGLWYFGVFSRLLYKH